MLSNTCTIELLENRTFLSTGQIDSAFGNAGVATAPVTVKNANSTDIATLPDGRFIVTGTTSGEMLSVIRFRADGSLDPTFGAGGRATSMLGGSAQALAVAIQPDLKTIVVGQRGDGFFILRYLTNGKHDKTFGNGGLVSGRFGTNISSATGVVIDSNGGIVITGTALGANGTRAVALARFNSSGSVDSSFGTPITPPGAILTRRNGQTVTKFSFSQTGPADFRVNDLTQASDGSFLVAGSFSTDQPLGSQQTDVAVARFGATGQADTTFGGDGLIVRDFGSDTEAGSGIAVDSRGRPVVALAGTGEFAAVRFTTRGHLDLNFGTSGVSSASDSTGSAADVLIDSGNKVLLAGTLGSSPRVARFQSTGQLDQTFGTDGLSDPIPFSATASLARLAQGPDDTILVAGAGGELGRTNTRLFSISRIS